MNKLNFKKNLILKQKIISNNILIIMINQLLQDVLDIQIYKVKI